MRRGLLAALSVVAVALVAACGSAVPTAAGGRAGPVPATGASEVAAAVGRVGELRDAALRSNDQAAFLATGGAATVFTVMTRMQVSGYAATPAGTPTGVEGARPGWRLPVRLTYRIGGVAGTQDNLVDWTLTLDSGRWQVRSEGAGQDLPAWDLPGATVSRLDAVVLVSDLGGAELTTVTTAVTTARAQVARLLGPVPAVLVVAPASRQDYEQVTGESLSAGAVAGVAEPSSSSGATGDVVVLVPRTLSHLSDVGLVAVAAHELTHATMAARSGGRVPDWLAEGMAQQVAYDGIPIATGRLAAPLITSLRADGLPDALPADAAFDPAAPQVQAAYLSAWRAVHVLVARAGLPAVASAYTRCAVAGDGDRGCASEIRSVTGWSSAAFLSAWRADLAALLAGSGRAQ